MCIAKNGVPPAVGKTVQLNVNCTWLWSNRIDSRFSMLPSSIISVQPQVSANIQLIGAKRRSEQTLTCDAEASPKPINYWTFGTGEMIVANDKFIVKVRAADQSVHCSSVMNEIDDRRSQSTVTSSSWLSPSSDCNQRTLEHIAASQRIPSDKRRNLWNFMVSFLSYKF